MSTTDINLVRDFTAAPGARYKWQGAFSGEEFRDDFLRPALQSGDVVLDLNGALGLPSSFLDEAIAVMIEGDRSLLGRIRVRLDDNTAARIIFSETIENRLGSGAAQRILLPVSHLAYC